MISENSPYPVYTGATEYVNREGAYGIWYPSNWRQIDMTGDHKGAIFAPFPDHIDTCIAVEKIMLPYKVVHGDLPTLRQGLKEGLDALPGIEIESFEESLPGTMVLVDVKYSFLEGEAQRKRWLRVLYWAEAQLNVIAQGQSVKDYEFWMPVFFNTMMTIDLGFGH